ncbi:MAG TPA: hypothetical protein VF426_13925 [Marmoricola sp.]
MSGSENHKKRRRSAPLLWGSGTVAAAILVLGVNGTLSGWGTAIINNTNNSVGSAKAVALSEASGGTVCVDTASTTTNEADCTSINKYGGPATTSTPDAAPLSPGGSRTVTVTLTNTGSEDASDLALTADGCSTTSNDDGTSAPTTSGDLCSVATVSVQCTSPSTLTTATADTPLASFTGADMGPLAAGASTDCTFTVKLPSTAPSGVSDQLAAQVLHWTLSA